MSELRRAACVGGGVIGAGWIARLVENGVAVRVYDPAPEAEAAIQAVLANGRRAAAALTTAPRPAEGRVTLCATLAEAVGDAALIVESVPEQLALKRTVYAQIEAAAAPDAIIASSTSGIVPTQLQRDMQHPERLLVAHPFNPVYLLPLVEVVGGERTAAAVMERAMAMYRALGMYPLHVKKEIDAFIADRLLEAVWREALWLVSDGIATTQEIDDAIRFGFGLRWAQMGLFETYRIAGGEAGMRHFLAQFGPCLSWPWTKLMDVPTFDDALVARIAQQSEAQSGAYSLRELERIRDDNLIGMLQVLKQRGWGAGQVLAEHQQRLRRRAAAQAGDESQPLNTLAVAVPGHWVDYNGHMTESRYLECFSNAADNFMAHIGADQAYVDGGRSYFTVETHLRHLREARADQPLAVTTQVLLGVGKKLQLFHRLQDASGVVIATGEQLLIHVDLTTRAACEPTAEVAAHLARIAQLHARLPAPQGAGRVAGARA